MSSTPWTGGFALACAGVVYVVLLSAIRQIDRTYGKTDLTDSTWWFGYARDIANLAGVVGYTLAFAVAGFPPALALLAGMLVTLGVYALDYLMARALRLRRIELTLGGLVAALAVVTMLFRVEAIAALDGLIVALFSGADARRGPG